MQLREGQGRRHITKYVKIQILRLLQKEKSSAELAKLFTVSHRTIQRYARLYKTYNRPYLNRDEYKQMETPESLSPDVKAFIRRVVKSHSDMYLQELAERILEEYGLLVPLSTLSRDVRRLGITRKRVEASAAERFSLLRARFRSRVAFAYQADQLVALDEAAFDDRVPQRA